MSLENSGFEQLQRALEGEPIVQEITDRPSEPREPGVGPEPISSDAPQDPYDADRQRRQVRRREFQEAAASEVYTLDANIGLTAGSVLWVADYLQDILVDNERKRGATMEAFKLAQPVIELFLKASRESDKYARFATRHEPPKSGGGPG